MIDVLRPASVHQRFAIAPVRMYNLRSLSKRVEAGTGMDEQHVTAQGLQLMTDVRGPHRNTCR